MIKITGIAIRGFVNTKSVTELSPRDLIKTKIIYIQYTFLSDQYRPSIE